MKKLNVKKIKVERRRLNRYQREAIGLCLYFLKSGFKTYWVGGAVRDLLLKRENYDIDVATSAFPEQTKLLLKKKRLKYYDVGEKFGTIAALLPVGVVEITTFRTERKYEDSRHPSKVRFITEPEKDVLRRDFTVNALLLDPENYLVLDYAGGLEDMSKKTIRFVGKAEERIKEDPLRMLRAVRFATVLNFSIAKKDIASIKKYARLITKISGDRIKIELDKIIQTDNFVDGIIQLERTGLMHYVLPEVDNLKKVKQSEDFHAEGTAFIHTLYVMQNLKGSGLDLRYAALFHDIGKAATASKSLRAGREHISFYGHARQSREMFAAISKRLRFQKKEREKIGYLVEHHMDLLHPEQIQQKTLIKWAKNRDFSDLIRLRIADTLGSKPASSKKNAPAKETGPLLSILRFALKSKPIFEKKLLTGEEVMSLLQIPQGKKVGAALEKIKEEQVKGTVKTKKQAEIFLKTLDNKI